MPLLLFPALALLCMLLDWLARLRANKPLEYLAKPLTIILLLAWLCQRTHLAGGVVWFGVALALSLIGDIQLMLPGEKFIGGLAAFFLAQLAFIGSFNLLPARISPATAGLAVLVLAVATWIFSRLSAALSVSGKTKLRLPLLLYCVVLSAMLFSALQCLVRPAWSRPAALLVAAGAALFFISDTLLAWNKFIRPLWLGHTLVHIAYHLGQLGITAGVIQQYAGSFTG